MNPKLRRALCAGAILSSGLAAHAAPRPGPAPPAARAPAPPPAPRARALPPPPVVDLDAVNPGTTVERDLCVAVALGPGAASECGDLRLAHALPAVRTLNQVRQPVLLYNSQHASPRPVVAAHVEVERAGLARVVATLRVNGTPRGRGVWRGSLWPQAGGPVRIAVDYEAAADPTGPYRYALEVRACYTDGACTATTRHGQLVVVNRRDSPFGAGWWLAGLEQLVMDPAGRPALWVGGDGSTRRYVVSATDTTVWTVTPALDRPDTLKRVGAGWLRRLPGGGHVWFDPSGRHMETQNRLGYATKFDYAGAQLQSIAVPPLRFQPTGASTVWVPLVGYYRFRYAAGGTLYEVESPGADASPRITTLHRTGARVDAIQDPDSTFVRFGYADAGTARVTSRTDRLRYRTDFRFGAGQRVDRSTLFMDSVVTEGTATLVRGVRPAEALGLATPAGGGAVPRDSAYALIDGPRTDVPDHTRLWVDRWGAPTRIRDAMGSETLLFRADERFPALVTRTRAPNGFEQSASYDQRGNLIRSVAHAPYVGVDSAVTQLAYEDPDAPDLPSRITSPTGETTWTGYDTLGRPDSVRPGTSDAYLTTFQYYPDTATAAARQLRSVTHPRVRQDLPAPVESLEYDERGNLTVTQSPLGIRTRVVLDVLGRVTTAYGPELGAVAPRTNTVTHYDAMGRDTASVTDGDADEGDLHVRTVRDAEGRVRQVERWSDPDPAQVGRLSRSWAYDAAGRAVEERDEQGFVLVRHPDAAGNDTLVTTRRRHKIRTVFDRLNRPTRRALDTAEYARAVRPMVWGSVVGPGGVPGVIREDVFPHPTLTADSAGRFIIPAEVTTFEYDPVTGLLAAAENGDALIRRRYHPSGALRTDSTFMRAYGSAGYRADHAFGTVHEYDRSGRRRRLHLPANLAGTGAVQEIGYDSVFGNLERVRSATGLEFTYEYNVDGSVKRADHPGQRWEIFTYDLDGRRVLRSVLSDLYVAGGGTGQELLHDSLEYDERGKVKQADLRNQMGSPHKNQIMMYSALGRLLRMNLNVYFGTGMRNEYFRWDALGNRRGERQIATNANLGWTISRFRPGTNQLQSSGAPDGMYNTGIPETTISYDEAGNQTWLSSVTEKHTAKPFSSREGAGWTYTHGTSDHRRTRSYYAPDDRLRATETRRCRSEAMEDMDHSVICSSVVDNATADAFEEYRYDPLGRRIMVRTRRRCPADYINTGTCTNTLTRFVWDGDQILAELRTSGADGADLEALAGGGPQFGSVLYTHGPGIDRPLQIERGEHASITSVLPIASWRGTFVGGTDASGAKLPCPEGGGECEILWPETGRAFFDRDRPAAQTNWIGSLAEGMEDASGFVYRRNRYYNPQTGAFTQADPIGLAGGLNTYGFADGDPVTYSDPYGLSSCEVVAPDACPYSTLENLRVAARLGRQLFGQAAGATRDFVRNYRQMRGANTIGADKYFHCKANCEAARRGRVGEATARVISDGREVSDFVKETVTDTFTVEEAQQHSADDQVANRRGRAGGAANPTADCINVCRTTRPRGLPDRY